MTRNSSTVLMRTRTRLRGLKALWEGAPKADQQGATRQHQPLDVTLDLGRRKSLIFTKTLYLQSQGHKTPFENKKRMKAAI